MIKYIATKIAKAGPIGKTVFLILWFAVSGVIGFYATGLTNQKTDFAFLGLAVIIVWIVFTFVVFLRTLAAYMSRFPDLGE